MNRREFIGTVAAAGATLAASRVIAGPATSGMRSNFSFKKEDTPVILFLSRKMAPSWSADEVGR